MSMIRADYRNRPTAKYWLYFSKGYPNRQNPEPLPKTIAKYVSILVRLRLIYRLFSRLHANVLVQWNVLDKRLGLPGQDFIALRNRPSLADLVYFPFAMPWMFTFLGVDIKDWPNIEAWSKRMMAREAVKAVLEKGPTYGH